MKEHSTPGTTGLIMNEPLIFAKAKTGRRGYSLPPRDVPEAPRPPEADDVRPNLPDLSELEVVRHYTRLSQWNFGVDSGTYPLGSCTMKYNPKINEKLAALPGLSTAHPLLPEELSQGGLGLMYELQELLAEITGLEGVSLQPAAGAHGEYAGMRIFYAYHHKKGQLRHKVLIPDTAHGTNPASAALCGFQAVPVASNEQGVLSAEAVAELMDDDTAGIMVTNPNTLGLFEENIEDIAGIVHEHGGLVYCDGANFNALMGIADMGKAGIDVLHLNLHKTFAAPHGGGGPGSGPVCVSQKLKPFLPLPWIVKKEQGYSLIQEAPDSIGRLHSFYGNFGVMIKAYAYILSMGPLLKTASQTAVLNANYIKERLKQAFHLPFDRPCMHECVLTDKLQQESKVSTLDIAKGLIDLGFHPPTIYFPLVVQGAMMIEPTESETKEDIDSLIEAFLYIAQQARDNPKALQEAPTKTKLRRLNETQAARNPCLTG